MLVANLGGRQLRVSDPGDVNDARPFGEELGLTRQVVMEGVVYELVARPTKLRHATWRAAALQLTYARDVSAMVQFNTISHRQLRQSLGIFSMIACKSFRSVTAL